ncbi:MAG: aminomethyl transferase family protein [Rhodospirillaceae bacterium]|nr:aminomethyl transferase family protein [Rhodospirillaceae bacterium]
MTPEPYEAQLLETPFHARTSSLCSTRQWGNWSGFASVNAYTSVDMEYFAARSTAALFDISPMTKYAITGSDAASYLNRLLTRNMEKVKPGRVVYAVWCNDAGMVIDDGTVFCLGENDYRLCSQERHLPWLLDSAIGYNVEIKDITSGIAALAVQGPTSSAVLKAMGLVGIENLKPYSLTEFDLDGHSLMVSRTGFTGDLGYELWIDPGAAELLWDRLMEVGSLYGLRPMGSEALEMTRIEAGFIQAGVEFFPGDLPTRPDRLRSPFELGMGWLVDFDKGHFIGRRALLQEKKTGSRYALVGLDIEGNKPALHSFVYQGKDTEVGIVASAMWSPTCKRNIAIASLKTPYHKDNHGLWVDVYVYRELKWERIHASCKVVDKQFFNPPRRWATPAGDR